MGQCQSTSVVEEDFNEQEIASLNTIFKQHAVRLDNDDVGINMDAFSKIIRLPGIIGERCFKFFDVYDHGYLTFNDFKEGLSLFCKQGEETRKRILFQIFDTDNHNSITRTEFRLIHSHLPPTILIAMINTCAQLELPKTQKWLDHNAKCEILNPEESKKAITILESLAFKEDENTISFQSFNMYLNKIPQLLAFVESSFPYDITHFDEDSSANNSIKEYNSLTGAKTINSQSQTPITSPPSTSYINSTNGKHINSNLFHSNSKSYVKFIPDDSIPYSSNQNNEDEVESTPSYLTTWNRYTRAFWCLDCVHCKSQIRYCYICGGNLYPVYNRKHQQQSLTNVNGIDSSAQETLLECNKCHTTLDLHHCPICGQKYNTNKVNVKLDTNPSLGALQQSVKSGYIFTLSTFNRIHKHFISIYNRYLYYYDTETNASFTDNIYLLRGCTVKTVRNEFMETKGYVGFSIEFPRLTTPVVFYVLNQQELNSWTSLIEKMAKVRLFEDSYHIVSKVGEGKFGVVYKCTNNQTNDVYAVKIINKQSYTKQSDYELIQREIGTLSIINHKHIVHLYDTFETDQYIYMVMEYIPGGDLFTHIAKHSLFTEIEAFQLMYPIIDAIAYLHRMGIVHRDIKPENIFCVKEIYDVKLGDFGLAQLVLPSEKLKKVYGTIAYMSPELLAGRGYTTKTDMWSLGVILYLIIQGDYPIRGNEKNEIIYNTIRENINFNYHNIKNKSPELQDLIRGLLNRDQNARYSAEQVMNHPWFRMMKKEYEKMPRGSISTINSDASSVSQEENEQNNQHILTNTDNENSVSTTDESANNNNTLNLFKFAENGN